MTVTVSDSGILFADGSLQPTALTTGTQTIAGAKTFSTAPVMTNGLTVGSANMAAPSGSAPLFGVRAWGNFAGATGATNSSGNMSCSRIATGNYTLTMATAMPDANYAVAVMAGPGNLGNSWNWLETSTVTRSTTQFSIGIATAGTAFDPSQFSVIVVR